MSDSPRGVLPAVLAVAFVLSTVVAVPVAATQASAPAPDHDRCAGDDDCRGDTLGRIRGVQETTTTNSTVGTSSGPISVVVPFVTIAVLAVLVLYLRVRGDGGGE